MEIEKLLNISDVSKILNVKESWVRKAVFRRELNCRKVGSLVRFSMDDILNFALDPICDYQS